MRLHQITVARISGMRCKRQPDTCHSPPPFRYFPSPLAMVLCVHVACICIFSNLASLAIAADFAKRYLPRAHGGNWQLREHTHMPLGPPIYSDWEAASQVFSLWRVEWFQVFQLPCHRESKIARAGVRRSGRLCLLPSRVVWICLVWSAECRGQSLHQIARLPPVTCHRPHATSCNMSLYIYIYRICINPTSRATICRSMFPAWNMTFYYGNSSRFQLQLQLTQANHIMKATNFNYDHYNKTLERRATTRRT